VTVHPPRYALPPPVLRPRSARVLAVLSAAVRERFGAVNLVLLALTYIVVLLFIVVPFYLLSLAPTLLGSSSLATFYLPFSSQVWFFFEALLATSVGASVIAGDVANRSITMYLARPITHLDYLTAKASAVGIWMFLGAVLPGIVGTLIVLALGYVDLPTALHAAGVFLGVGILTLVLFTALAVLFSALAPRATYAGAAIFGGLVGAEIVALALHGISGQSAVLYGSLEQDLLAVAQAGFGVAGGSLDPVVAATIVVAVAAGALGLAYVRLARAEVVAE
jgi:ABC-type transport system involved in multi-copper enzyme maturation permease subunit